MKKISHFLILFFLASGLNAQEVNGIIVLDTNNLHVIKVWGTATERAYAYGYLLADQIEEAYFEWIKPYIIGTNYENMREIILEGEDIYLDSVFIYEAVALVEGITNATGNQYELDWIDVVIGNSIESLIYLLNADNAMNCSSLMSWGDATTGTDLEGKSVISHHTDLFPPIPALYNNQVIVVNFPSEPETQEWLLIHIAGSLVPINGMNRHISVFGQAMSDYNEPVFHNMSYVPYGYALRKALESEDYNNDLNKDVWDVKSALDDCTNGIAGGEIIAVLGVTQEDDGKTALVCELASNSPTHIYRDNTYPDSIPGDNLYTANSQIARNNAMNFCNRYDDIRNHIGTGTQIGIEENWNLAKDYSHLPSNIQFIQYAPEMDHLRVALRNSNGIPAYQTTPFEFSLEELFIHPLATVNYESSAKENGLTISIIPNPSKDKITLSSPALKGNTLLSIFNVSGEKVIERQLTGTETQIDISTLPPGVYFVKVQNEKRVDAGKIIKQ